MIHRLPGGLVIAEPMTLATDLLLAVVATVLAARLLRGSGRLPERRGARAWAGAFLATALAALAGGLWHGFHAALPPLAGRGLWKLTLVAVGVASFLMLAGSTLATVRGGARRVLLAAAAVELLLYCGWIAGHDDFLWVIADYGSAMVGVLALHAWAWVERREPAAPWIAAGVAVSMLAAAIQAAGLAPHPRFNANDLYHLVQMIALALFYRGAANLHDREPRAPARSLLRSHPEG